MNTLYRLYTEERQNLARLTGAHFKGFTLIEASGHWMGLGENTTIIEILTDDSAGQRACVYTLAEDIREENAQHTVIVTEQKVETVLFSEETQ